MEIQGTWTKDEEGNMDFETSHLQRLYETITDDYYRLYNQCLADFDDDDAFYQAKEAGYEMITDYKNIDDKEEFATTYITPDYVLDVWYGQDKRNRRVYDRGWLRVRQK